MRPNRSFLLGAAVALLALLCADRAFAALVYWHIDSSQSYVRLNVGDQNLTLSGIEVNARIRNQNTNANWTDAGGRRATVQGIIATDVVRGPGASLASIQFLGPSGMALEDKNLRPNPSAFDPNVTSTANPDGTFTNTGAGAAAYGGRFNSNVILTAATIGFFAISDVDYRLTSATILLGAPSGSIPSSSTSFGIVDATFALDGQAIPLISGLVIPDALSNVSMTGTNSAAGSITWLGADQYQLTYNVSVPVVWQVPGVGNLNGTLTGQIVAAAIFPEPSTWALGTMAALGIAGLARRRR